MSLVDQASDEVVDVGRPVVEAEAAEWGLDEGAAKGAGDRVRGVELLGGTMSTGLPVRIASASIEALSPVTTMRSARPRKAA